MKQTQLFVGNEWLPGDSQATLVNPYSGDVIAMVGYASVRQAQHAIEVAAEAFTSFRHTPAYERANILYRAVDLLAQRREEAVALIVAEAAKPIRAARAEIDRTVETYRFAAEAAKNLRTESVPMDAAPRGESYLGLTMRVPLGVVSAITPFNFPFNLVAHKVGPAMAAGNTIVLKPAEQTPLSALFLATLFQDAGLPAGVLNIIPGEGPLLSEVLTTHPDVKYVTFTGSPRVGRLIRAQAGLRRVTLELGSNSPLLIDTGFAPDELNRIADAAISGAFAYQGQVCISIQRIYVHADDIESFVPSMIAKAKSLVTGPPEAETTDVSALISANAASRLQSWLDHAVARGAHVACGGTFEGSVMSPTVLTDVPADVELNCEEAFGPVVLIAPYQNWTEAITLANQSKFGLNAGLFTKSIEHALQATRSLETGAVLVNEVPTFRLDHMPYGGIKESGVGREGVSYAIEDMMETKFVAFKSGVFDA